jgi:hypothetical protein
MADDNTQAAGQQAAGQDDFGAAVEWLRQLGDKFIGDGVRQSWRASTLLAAIEAQRAPQAAAATEQRPWADILEDMAAATEDVVRTYAADGTPAYIAALLSFDDRLAGHLDRVAASCASPAPALPVARMLLSVDDVSKEFLRWSIGDNDASLAFHRMPVSQQIQCAFTDGLMRGIQLAQGEKTGGA